MYINLRSVLTALKEWKENHYRDNEWCKTDVELMIKVLDGSDSTIVRADDIYELVRQGDESRVHPKRAELSRLAREYRKLAEEFREEAYHADEPDAEYETTVYETPKSSDGECNFTARLLNMDEFDKHFEYWGQCNRPDQHRSSVHYYLVPIKGTAMAFVSHRGGGWLMLKDDLVVPIAEWAQMLKDGKIPAEWLRSSEQ